MPVDPICKCGHDLSSHSTYAHCRFSGCDCRGFENPDPDPNVYPHDVMVQVNDESEEAHLAVMLEAFGVFCDRNRERKSGWRRAGGMGAIMNCYAKAERAFIQAQSGEMPNGDHFIDLVNYAVFARLLAVDGDLKGDWPWSLPRK